MTLPESIDGSAAVTSAKTVALINHVRENNVSYLLGILIGHMLGITDMVFEYGQGMC